MLRQNRKNRTHEAAARLGARDNLLLGGAQLLAGVATGNYGFIVEAGHQAADSASLKAKADAMKLDCSPKKARRLRKAAATVLLAGGLFGIAGGIKHLHEGSSEEHGSAEITIALAGAAVNTLVARRSHGAQHTHEDEGELDSHAHHHGAAADAIIHMATDMGTGIAYAGALIAEPWLPGVTNFVLIANGAIVGGAGVHTLQRIHRDDHSVSTAHEDM